MKTTSIEDARRDANRLWTVAEVAQRLSISRASVYLLVQQRKLACHRIGAGRGAVRISQADLQAFLDNCHCATREAEVGERRAPRAARPKLSHLEL